ncbi:hypothetical protein F3Y22_tig00116976pilonHSYRG00083 [Hibiscus syriacus]|uniref:Fe2OG dioxygenase domain-containing protein n=1 Tax=Hibiscus syriacus TaxID=106335 RepID=A0A6A2X782_HIBSY|nr:hypothetical protein F3Y22_tig00116976pilonHSYRG00083 [Hibiscus syriacus]
MFEEGLQAMRMNYYPPCPEPELAIGLCAHSDPIGLTILLHINEMEGLQVKKDGAWVPIKPLQNAFVINIGDIMEMIDDVDGYVENRWIMSYRALLVTMKRKHDNMALTNPPSRDEKANWSVKINLPHKNLKELKEKKLRRNKAISTCKNELSLYY